MRVNAYVGATFGAGVNDGRVGFHIGYQRFTATPTEAIELARQLVEAAENATNSRRDVQP